MKYLPTKEEIGGTNYESMVFPESREGCALDISSGFITSGKKYLLHLTVTHGDETYTVIN